MIVWLHHAYDWFISRWAKIIQNIVVIEHFNENIVIELCKFLMMSQAKLKYKSKENCQFHESEWIVSTLTFKDIKKKIKFYQLLAYYMILKLRNSSIMKIILVEKMSFEKISFHQSSCSTLLVRARCAKSCAMWYVDCYFILNSRNDYRFNHATMNQFDVRRDHLESIEWSIKSTSL